MNKYNKERIRGALGASSLLGKGSSRSVYSLEIGIVVKVANNNAGYSQNEAEVIIYKSGLFNSIVNEILWYSEDFEYIITWECELFQSLFDMLDTLEIEDMRDILDKMPKIKELNKFIGLPTTTETITWSNLGINTDGSLVLIDYGFTSKIRDQYYSGNWDNIRVKEVL